MGTWGMGAFDNDTAGDWASALEDFGDLSLVQDAVDAVLETADEYLDAELAWEGLAACEVVACLKGARGKDNTDDVNAWVEAHPMKPPDDLVEKGVRAIDRILAPESELLELWEESDEFDQWKASVTDLRRRVSS